MRNILSAALILAATVLLGCSMLSMEYRNAPLSTLDQQSVSISYAPFTALRHKLDHVEASMDSMSALMHRLRTVDGAKIRSLEDLFRALKQKYAHLRENYDKLGFRPGITGPQGLPGQTGPLGAAGPDGAPGPMGFTGSPGAQGPIGVVGVQGAQGVHGISGPVGPVGPRGLDGITGPMGVAGDPGRAGFPGADGAVGRVGTEGPPGTNGPSEITGPRGAKGPAGAPGSEGHIVPFVFRSSAPT